jgi:putative methionine-R-sulfoxide reductase with GAF domain
MIDGVVLKRHLVGIPNAFMDHYSILDQNSPLPAPEPKPAAQSDSDPQPRAAPDTASALRFPAEDGGKSLSEMAQRDLNVALQLLAERAQYITGASGAAVALREGEELICRARAGPSAPEIGAQLQVSSGLTGESVRTREILRCNDATTDPRVDQQSCRILGIRSVMVMPLLHEQEVTGVFELLSDRTHAFEERDVIALQRLGEMIATAIDHADAVKGGIQRVSAESSGQHVVSVPGEAPEAVAAAAEAEPSGAEPSGKDRGPVADQNAPPMMKSSPSPQPTPAAVRPMLANIRKCESCGFPVSGSRTLCLDCEAARNSPEQADRGAGTAAPAFLAELGGAPEKSWLREHMYTIGIVLMVIFTAILLLWLRPS